MSLSKLPDPAWADAEAECLACGYSLSGLAPPILCPECGLPYSGRQLIAYGLADARSTMSPLRMAGMIASCIFFYIGPQILLQFGFFVSWWIPAVLAVVGLAGLVFFIRSGPRSYGGTARLVFDHAGVTVLPLALKKQRKVDEKWAVCTFTSHETVELRQISDTWAKVRIRKADGGTLFSGGIQSPRERHDEVLQTIRWIAAQRPDTPPPLPSPTPG